MLLRVRFDIAKLKCHGCCSVAAVAKGTLAKIEDDLFEILHGAPCPMHVRFSGRAPYSRLG